MYHLREKRVGGRRKPAVSVVLLAGISVCMRGHVINDFIWHALFFTQLCKIGIHGKRMQAVFLELRRRGLSAVARQPRSSPLGGIRATG